MNNSVGGRKIPVWFCHGCGMLTRHQLRYCSNCGSVLRRREMTSDEFTELAQRFHSETGWNPLLGVKYDHDTGEPIERRGNSGKERI
jgi:hypothetical protein